MSKRINDAELKEIRERVAKATKGPWEYGAGGIYSEHAKSYNYSMDNTREICCLNDGEYISNINMDNDANFIAHARGDIPRLLAEIERMRHTISWGVSCSACSNQLAD